MAEGSTIGGGGIGPFSFFGATFGAAGAAGATASPQVVQVGAASAQAGAAHVGAAQVGAAHDGAASPQVGAAHDGAAHEGAAAPQAGSAQPLVQLLQLLHFGKQQLMFLNRNNRLRMQRSLHFEPQGSQQPLPAPHEGPAAPQAGSAAAQFGPASPHDGAAQLGAAQLGAAQLGPALPHDGAAAPQAGSAQPVVQVLQPELQQPRFNRPRRPENKPHCLPQPLPH
ncbi:MAG: hypothetical protein K8U03_00765 [Planctomycetia bacterium]|nr:hypothetical protein [Planctomycetia bacterium]